jgi:hypothetical protein
LKNDKNIILNLEKLNPNKIKDIAKEINNLKSNLKIKIIFEFLNFL